MFRHVVMFKWSEQVDDEAKATIVAGLDQLAELDAVTAYRHGPDAGISEGNWDYVVVGDFNTVDDYRTYATDQDHQDLIAQHIAPNITARAAVQYEVH